MRSAKLNVFIGTALAVSIGFIMAILNLAPSWSQLAGTLHDPLMYGTLGLITVVFITASWEHPKRFKEITKLPKGRGFRLEHSFRYTSYMFLGIIAFSVNSPTWWVETLHLVFTALALFSGYSGLMMYPDTVKGHNWAIAGLVFGIGGFVLGYVFNLWSIGWGEALAALPLGIFMLVTWKDMP